MPSRGVGVLRRAGEGHRAGQGMLGLPTPTAGAHGESPRTQPGPVSSHGLSFPGPVPGHSARRTLKAASGKRGAQNTLTLPPTLPSLPPKHSSE